MEFPTAARDLSLPHNIQSSSGAHSANHTPPPPPHFACTIFTGTALPFICTVHDGIHEWIMELSITHNINIISTSDPPFHFINILQDSYGLGRHILYSDSLRAGWSRDRILVGGEIFRTRPGRPWGPLTLLYNGYRVSFLGVKWLGHGVDHPPPSSVKVKERVELYLYSPYGPSRPVLGRTLPSLQDSY